MFDGLFSGSPSPTISSPNRSTSFGGSNTGSSPFGGLFDEDIKAQKAAQSAKQQEHQQLITQLQQQNQQNDAAVKRNTTGNIFKNIKIAGGKAVATSAAKSVPTVAKGIGVAAVNTGKAPIDTAILGIANLAGNKNVAQGAREDLTHNATNSFIGPLAQTAVMGGTNLAANKILNNKNTNDQVKQNQLKEAVNPGYNQAGFDLGDSGPKKALKEAGLFAGDIATPLLTKGGMKAFSDSKALTASAKNTINNVTVDNILKGAAKDTKTPSPTPETAVKTPPKASAAPVEVAPKPAKTRNEVGAVDLSGIQDMIDKHAKINQATGDISKDFSVTQGKEKVIKNEVADSLDSSAKLTQADKQTLQNYRDAKMQGQTADPLPSHLQAEDARITALNKGAMKADAEKARLEGNEAKAQAIEARNPETYTHLMAKGKGSNLEYNLRGDNQNPLSVGGLSKTTSGSKAQTFHKVTDEQGNERIVAIKNTTVKNALGKKVAQGKTVTAMDNGGSATENLGRLNLKTNQDFLDKELKPYQSKVSNLQKEFDTLSKVKTKGGVSDARINSLAQKVSLLEDPGNMTTLTRAEAKSLRDAKLKLQELTKVKQPGTNATGRLQTINRHLIDMNNKINEISSKYDPETLDKKVFKGKDGHTYTISQASQAEKTKATGQKYFVDPTLSAHLNYADSQVALAHMRFVENTKSILEDKGLAVRDGETAPKGFTRTTSPYFHGYRLEPKLAAELDSITRAAPNDLQAMRAVSRAVRQTIVYMPIRHNLNQLVGFVADRADKWLSVPAYYRGGKSFSRAFKAVMTKNDLYNKYLESGTSMMSADDAKLSKAVSAQIKGHLDNKELLVQKAKSLGMSPKTLYNAIQHVSVWEVQDILNIARVEERQMGTLFHPKGMSFEKALAKTERYNFQYKVPPQVGPGKLGRSISNTLKGDKFFFAPYTYDKYRIVANMLRDTANLKHPRDATEAAAKLAAVGVIGSAVWGEVDKGLQHLTGNKNTHVSAPGVASVGELANKVRQGKAKTSDYTSQLSLSGTYSAGSKLINNSDPFQPGGKISDPNAPLATRAKQTANWLTQQLNPVQKYKAGQANSPSSKLVGTALSLSGVSNPKNSPETNKLSSLKHDSLPIAQAAYKKAVQSNDMTQANLIKDAYNQQILDAAKKALQADGKPVPSDQRLLFDLKKGYYLFTVSPKTIRNDQKPQQNTLDKLLRIKR